MEEAADDLMKEGTSECLGKGSREVKVELQGSDSSRGVCLVLSSWWAYAV